MVETNHHRGTSYLDQTENKQKRPTSGPRAKIQGAEARDSRARRRRTTAPTRLAWMINSEPHHSDKREAPLTATTGDGTKETGGGAEKESLRLSLPSETEHRKADRVAFTIA